MKDSKWMSKANVLVVDDTPENLQLIAKELKEEEYEIRPVLNGEQAIKAALSQPPDLILLDIVMPGMDGYKVLQKLKANSKTEHIPVIFLTSLSQNEHESKGLEMGAVDFITKPIEVPILKARIKTHLRLKKYHDRLIDQNYELRIINEELEAFSYSVSHDLKAPLGMISVYTQFIRDHFIETEYEEGVEDVDSIELACKKIRSLIDELMELARISREEVDFERMNISLMANAIMDDITKNNRNIVSKFICSENVTAEGDKDLIGIALQNLLHNAWKYSSKKESPIVEFGCVEMSQPKTYFVKDNGVGFDLKKAQNLFKPFNRQETSKGFEGTGVGLTIVKELLIDTGGRSG